MSSSFRFFNFRFRLVLVLEKDYVDYVLHVALRPLLAQQSVGYAAGCVGSVGTLIEFANFMETHCH